MGLLMAEPFWTDYGEIVCSPYIMAVKQENMRKKVTL